MGVARHEHIFISFAELLQLVEQTGHRLRDGAELFTHEQLEVHEHLIVARASGMDFFAYIAKAAGEKEFYLRVNVLNARLDDKFAALDHGCNIIERVGEEGEFVGSEQTDALKHLDVGERSLHVVACQLHIEFAVVAHGEFFYHFVGLEALAP